MLSRRSVDLSARKQNDMKLRFPSKASFKGPVLRLLQVEILFSAPDQKEGPNADSQGQYLKLDMARTCLLSYEGHLLVSRQPCQATPTTDRS